MTNRTHPLSRVLTLAAILGALSACKSTPLATFETPEEAMRAIAEVAGTDGMERAEQLFGSNGVELLRSGDEVADREDASTVKQQIQERLAFEDAGAGTKIALLGTDGWPFPIPLVLEQGRWRFDVEAGREELANRRVGRNELLTIATLHEYVEGQREYRSAGRDGNPPAFARRLISSDGKHDGLYWPAAQGEPESPLGPLAAAAAQEGYTRQESGPTPFHGYFYRTLPGQGPSAPGGEKSYLDERGLLTRGHALLAWPAKYGSSGVMTFQVNQQGIVIPARLRAGYRRARRALHGLRPGRELGPDRGLTRAGPELGTSEQPSTLNQEPTGIES